MVCPVLDTRTFFATWTGPLSGSPRMGVTALAEPTIGARGQFGSTLIASAYSHSACALSGSSASDLGSVTATCRMLAWPARCLSSATTPGCFPVRSARRLPVSFTASFGANARASQPPNARSAAPDAAVPSADRMSARARARTRSG